MKPMSVKGFNNTQKAVRSPRCEESKIFIFQPNCQSWTALTCPTLTPVLDFHLNKETLDSPHDGATLFVPR